ncbi:hypothetical protein [Bartonella sp. DGB2]|uniref:hypothetical protein n=1 Tax=Bartonella sp. DGB2 TaxID=3388426 RepID=UPI00398FF902
MTKAVDLMSQMKKREDLRTLNRFQSLQTAVTKLTSLKSTPPTLTTRALLDLLVCQNIRSRRNGLPPVRIHLRVKSNTDTAPLKLCLGSSNR